MRGKSFKAVALSLVFFMVAGLTQPLAQAYGLTDAVNTETTFFEEAAKPLSLPEVQAVYTPEEILEGFSDNSLSGSTASDGDQLFNPDGDEDGDGLKNIDELLYGTSLFMSDTDGDGLSDYEEIRVYATDPLNPDTDGDGIYDGPQMLASRQSTMRSAGSTGSASVGKYASTSDGRVSVAINGNANLNLAELKIEEVDDPILNSLEGLAGKPVNITAGGYEIETATITMKYDPETLNGIRPEELTLYWVDTDKGRLVPLENSLVNKNNQTVTAVTNHLSYYLLGDPNLQINLEKLDVMFVIDNSGSMDDNDPLYSRIDAVKTFTDFLDANETMGLRLGIVTFSSYPQLSRPLSGLSKTGGVTDTSYLDGLKQVNDATNLQAALNMAANQFDYDKEDRSRLIILISDGVETLENNEAVLNEANRFTASKKKIMVNTINVGPDDASAQVLRDIAEVTKGAYYYIDPDFAETKEDIQSQYDVIYRKFIKQIIFEAVTEPDDGVRRAFAAKYPEKYRGMDYDEALVQYTRDNANMLTGNFLESAVDFTVDGFVKGFSFERTYNSDAASESTVMGKGWITNFDSSVKAKSDTATVTAYALNVRDSAGGKIIGVLQRGAVVDIAGYSGSWYEVEYDGLRGFIHSAYAIKNNTLEVTYPTGTKINFPVDANGGITTPYGVYDRLEKATGDIAYRLIRKDSTVYGYLADGKLAYTEDVYKNRLTLTYEGSGEAKRLARVTDPSGRMLSFTYTNGRLTGLTGPDNYSVRYEYDSAGELLTKVYAPENVTTSYTYYDETQHLSQKPLLKQITDGNGNQVVKNDYDPFGRLVRQYDGENQVTYHIYGDLFTDGTGGSDQDAGGNGKLVSYYVDKNRWASGITYSRMEHRPINEAHNNNKKTNRYYYVKLTENGDWTEITDISMYSEDNTLNPVYVAYVAALSNGNLPWKEVVRDIGPDGKERSVSVSIYDKYGNQVEATDGEGHTVKMAYTSYNGLWRLTKHTDKDGNITGYVYDSTGAYLESIHYPEGKKVYYTYLKAGTVKGLLSGVKEYHRGENGESLLISETVYGYEDGYGNLTSETTLLGSSTRFTTYYDYDIYGRVIRQKDPRDAAVAYTYDRLGRLVSETDGEGKVRRLTYDHAGNLLTDENRNGQTTRYAYDRENRVIRVTSPLGYQTTYKYDASGNKVEQRDAKGNATKYAYDEYNRLVSSEDALGNVTAYTYDLRDNLTMAVTSPTASKTEYTYDLRGLKLSESVYSEAGKRTTNYTYTPGGALKTADYGNGRVAAYTYDGLGRVVKVSDGAGFTDANGNSLEKVTETFYYTEIQGGNRYDVVKTEQLLEGSGTGSGNEKAVSYLFYDLPGRLSKSVDAQANTTLYEYDASGNVMKITDPESNATHFEYSKTNRLIKTVDAGGIVESRGYDAMGNLINIKKTGSAGDEILSYSQYFYDKENRLVLEQAYYTDGDGKFVHSGVSYLYDENGNIMEKTDPAGKITYYTYDALNRKLSESNPGREEEKSYYGYDGLGRLIWETDRKEWDKSHSQAFLIDGHYRMKTAYAYDMEGRLTQVTDSLGRVTEERIYDVYGNLRVLTDANGNPVSYEYDAFNRPAKEIYPGEGSEPAYEVSYAYNAAGFTTAVRDNAFGSQGGTLVEYRYDRLGRVVEEIRSDGAGGTPVTISREYDGNGNVVREKDGNGIFTTYGYSAYNQLASTTRDGKETSYVYDFQGNLLEETSYLGNKTTYTYNEAGWLTLTTDGEGKVVEKLDYDSRGLQTHSTDALGNTVSFEYDDSGRLIRTADALGVKEERTYDANGNVTGIKDGNGTFTRYEYDETNRNSRVVNALNETTEYGYDPTGNLVSQKDGEGKVTLYEYTRDNQLKRRIDPEGRTASGTGYLYVAGRVISYTYYPGGSLKAMTDRNGVTTRYTYDFMARLVKEAAGEEGQAGYLTVSYAYDCNGNQTRITDSTGSTYRDYDAMNRVITKTTPLVSGASRYVYDIIEGLEEGRWAEKTTDPKGNVTTRVYDRAGRLARVINGELTSQEATSYTYYDNGARRSVTYPDGSFEFYAYDNRSQLSTLTIKDRNQLAGMGLSYSYTYDETGNQLSEQKIKDGTVEETVYSYDELNRLETVEEPNGRKSAYTYDKAGNRLTERVEHPLAGGGVILKSYTYDNRNRLESLTTKEDSRATGKDDYTYDANGNLLAIDRTGYESGSTGGTGDSGGTGSTSSTHSMSSTSSTSSTGVSRTRTEHTYDAFNQLITSTTANGVQTNTYDGQGLRVAASVPGEGVIRYVYEYDKVILETDGNGAQTGRNIYGTNLLVREADGSRYYYRYNGHGDVTGLVDAATGAYAATYTYDAFGNILEQTGTASNSITYAGYTYDKETGLYYLNARMYDPATARFLQEDTYGGEPGDPLSLNRYTYGRNNPLKYYDPTGHSFINYGNLFKYYNATDGKTITLNEALAEMIKLTFSYYKAQRISSEASHAIKSINSPYGNANKTYWEQWVELQSQMGADSFFYNVEPSEEYQALIQKGVIDPAKYSLEDYINANGPEWEAAFKGQKWVQSNTGNPNGNIWMDLRGAVSPAKDFVQGVGAGFLESVTMGTSSKAEPYYNRDNENIYLAGKLVGDVVTGLTSYGGASAMGTLGFVTAPTGVGAVAGAGAAVYLTGVSANAMAQAGMTLAAITNGNSGGKSEGESKPVYKPSPKHDPKSGWGSPNPIPDEKVGQELLDNAYTSSKNKQKYNIYEDKLIKFQPDGDGWHPYEVTNPAKEVPADVLRKMLDDGLITKVQYKKFITNK